MICCKAVGCFAEAGDKGYCKQHSETKDKAGIFDTPMCSVEHCPCKGINLYVGKPLCNYHYCLVTRFNIEPVNLNKANRLDNFTVLCGYSAGCVKDEHIDHHGNILHRCLEHLPIGDARVIKAIGVRCSHENCQNSALLEHLDKGLCAKHLNKHTKALLKAFDDKDNAICLEFDTNIIGVMACVHCHCSIRVTKQTNMFDTIVCNLCKKNTPNVFKLNELPPKKEEAKPTPMYDYNVGDTLRIWVHDG